MHRTIGDSYGIDGSKRVFRQGNPPAHQATQVTYDTMNALQEEVAVAIEGLGGTLNPPGETIAQMTQLRDRLIATFGAEAATRDANDRTGNSELARTQLDTASSALSETTMLAALVQTGIGSLSGFLLARLSAVRLLIGPGVGVDTGKGDFIRIPSGGIRKDIDTVWAQGDSVGGRAGTLVNGTWFHVFVIKNTAGTITDAGFDTDINAANLLTASGFTKYRRVGSVYYVNASTGIRDFYHDLSNGFFMLKNPALPYIGAVSIATSPAVTPLSIANVVPPGLEISARLTLLGENGVSAYALQIWDGVLGAAIPGPGMNFEGPAGFKSYHRWEILTNASAGFYASELAAPSGSTLTLAGLGYYDRRILI